MVVVVVDVAAKPKWATLGQGETRQILSRIRSAQVRFGRLKLDQIDRRRFGRSGTILQFLIYFYREKDEDDDSLVAAAAP